MAFKINDRWEMDLSPGTDRSQEMEAGLLTERCTLGNLLMDWQQMDWDRPEGYLRPGRSF